MKKINLTLNRLEKGDAFLVNPEGEEIRLPKDFLPEIKIGSSFSIEIKTQEELSSSDEKLAKAILNEILKGSDSG